MVDDHYFTQKPSSEYTPHTITCTIRGKSFCFLTASGVFSKHSLDRGTALLLESAILKDGWKVLDIGCGYGIVGISVKKLFPKSIVMLADINERALAVSKENAHHHHVNISIVQSNLYENITGQFDTILTNPPQKAGKEVCEAIISQAPEHLVKGGLLQLVARHNYGGRSLEKVMKEVFGNVVPLAKQGGFRVYVSQKK